MEILPFVSFILWATGLLTTALVAFAVRDWFAERNGVAQSVLPPQPKAADCSLAAVPAMRVERALPKAA
ncbi:hypothetical protein [Solimonas variicoloris]|uniref:hypothetical protein n=1 Tax=Solimonas variicoloris TaxID=254408 RepID=UPI00036F6ADE|nr:hypothetical protein [Solimonas variicoloris]